MTNDNLYLIGTHHIDLDGPRRLEGLLEQISPDVVALEFHKDLEAFIQERAKKKQIGSKDILTEAGLLLTPEQIGIFLDLEAFIQERAKKKQIGSKDILTEAGLLLTPEQIGIFLNYEREINSVVGYEFHVSKAYTKTNPNSRLEYIDISPFENGVQEFKEGIEGMELMITTMAQEPEFRELCLEILSKGRDGFFQQMR